LPHERFGEQPSTRQRFIEDCFVICPVRIALVSDIHGNLVALESIASEIEEADQVVCLGDVAASGPQPRDTLSFLRRSRWPCVLGNTDEVLAGRGKENLSRLKMPEDERQKMVSLHGWTASKIDGADRRFLAGFKQTIEVNTRSHSILCYHGSPRSNTEKILSTTPEDRLFEIFSGRVANVYAGGHTHEQMVRKFGSSLVVNPGSVGLPFFTDPHGDVKNPIWAEYAMLSLSGDSLRIDLRRTRYSGKALEEAVRRSGMPDPGWWLRDWVWPGREPQTRPP